MNDQRIRVSYTLHLVASYGPGAVERVVPMTCWWDPAEDLDEAIESGRFACWVTDNLVELIVDNVRPS